MRIHTLQQTTTIRSDLNRVWDYFSSPENLNEITPEDMQFKILSEIQGKKMYPGMIINYKIKPFPFFSFRWTTEITQCFEGKYFIDEQRFGPYRFWHHQHHFEIQGGKIIMTDIVSYALPFGIIGNIANSLFIRKKLNTIFDYRQKVIETVFAKN